MKRLLFLLPLALSACVPIHHHGRVYHLVIGVGVFKTEHTNGVDVVKSKTLGVYAGDRRLGAGWSSVVTASIPTNSNITIEIK